MVMVDMFAYYSDNGVLQLIVQLDTVVPENNHINECVNACAEYNGHGRICVVLACILVCVAPNVFHWVNATHAYTEIANFGLIVPHVDEDNVPHCVANRCVYVDNRRPSPDGQDRWCR